MKLISANSQIDLVRKQKQAFADTSRILDKLLDGSLDLESVEYFSYFYQEWLPLDNQDFCRCVENCSMLRIKERTIKVNTPYYSPDTDIWYTVVHRGDTFQLKRAGDDLIGDEKLYANTSKNPQALTRSDVSDLGCTMSEEMWNNLKEAKIDV